MINQMHRSRFHKILLSLLSTQFCPEEHSNRNWAFLLIGYRPICDHATPLNHFCQLPQHSRPPARAPLSADVQPESLPAPQLGPLISWLILAICIEPPFLPPGLLALSWYESCLSQFPQESRPIFLPDSLLSCLVNSLLPAELALVHRPLPWARPWLAGVWGPHGGRCQVAPGVVMPGAVSPGTGHHPGIQVSPSFSQACPNQVLPPLFPNFSPSTSLSLPPPMIWTPLTPMEHCDGICTHLPAAPGLPNLLRTSA